MEVLEKTIKKAERSTAQGLRRLPGVGTVLRFFNVGRPSESRQTLTNSVGRVVLVGDFSYENDPKRQKNIADRVVKLLRNNDIIDPVSSVDIRVMVPETAEEAMMAGATEERREPVNQAADSLAHSFNAALAGDPYMHVEPVVAPSVENDNLTAEVGLCIGEVAPGCAGEAFGETLVVVANSDYLSRAFPHLKNHNMHGGGVAVLAAVGESSDAIRFDQLWPAAPPPLAGRVA